MKLISLYIENFGGLQEYRLDFETGITSIHAPNGFGKSTLAEFIRAMFYGFPRKAKTLDKSRRQKYTPWQGGKFGGNLTFEYQGRRYRIERTFGATPKSDSFNLIDPDTGKKSTRFTENIGLELFQLDSDSFERSTYMPQLHDLTSLTTDGIQAKLGDLVEDAGDMGNYEKAILSLRSARSGFIPYRGSGGSVNEAQNQISLLQSELERSEGLKAAEAAAMEQIAGLQDLLAARKEQQEQIRQRILRASEAAAVTAAHREYAQITGREAKLTKALAEIAARYPQGLPSEEEIRLARDIAAKAAVLAAQQITGPEDLEAEAFAEENRSRFEGHLPTQEELETCRNEISRRNTAVTEAENTGLSPQEQQQYETLLPLYESGQLDEARLDALDSASRELDQIQHLLDQIRVPEEEQNRLAELKTYFESGIPQETEILACRQDLAKLYELRREKASLLEKLAQLQSEKLPPLLIIGLVMSLAALASGAVLLFRSLPLLGWLSLGAGLLGLALSGMGLLRIWQKNKDIHSQRADFQTRLKSVTDRIDGLDETVSGFTGKYTALRPLSDALNQIHHNYEQLKQRSTEIAATFTRRRQLTAEAEKLHAQLAEQLGSNDFHRAVLDLRLSRSQFLDLVAERKDAAEKMTQLQAEIQQLTEQITGFLGTYFPNPAPAQFHSLLSELQRSSERYTGALERLENRSHRLAQHAKETDACEKVLSDFFSRLGTPRQEGLREQLLQIRDDLKTNEERTWQLDQVLAEKAAFEAQHQSQLEKQPDPVPEDLADLRLTENRLREESEADTGLLLRQQQLLNQTRDAMSRIPDLRDNLVHWQEKYRTHRKQAALLDDTMSLLEKARENLQNSYLGPVRSSFQNYMDRLLEEDARQILLSPDLEVQLERKGQARELGYFSAGQTDTVMLCMRLALVDALFCDVKPFVILDDPFVNLDDRRTEQALALLADLSKDRQILYLTCNSSRTL